MPSDATASAAPLLTRHLLGCLLYGVSMCIPSARAAAPRCLAVCRQGRGATPRQPPHPAPLPPGTNTSPTLGRPTMATVSGLSSTSSSSRLRGGGIDCMSTSIISPAAAHSRITPDHAQHRRPQLRCRAAPLGAYPRLHTATPGCSASHPPVPVPLMADTGRGVRPSSQKSATCGRRSTHTPCSAAVPGRGAVRPAASPWPPTCTPC